MSNAQPSSGASLKDSLPPSLSFHSVTTAVPALLRAFPLPNPSSDSTQKLTDRIPADAHVVADAEVMQDIAKHAKISAKTSKSHEMKLLRSAQPKRGELKKETRAVFDELQSHRNEMSSTIPKAKVKRMEAATAGNEVSDAALDSSMELRPKSGSALPPGVMKPKAAAKKPKKGDGEDAAAAAPTKADAAKTKAIAKQEKESLLATERLVSESPSTIIATCVKEKQFDPARLTALCNAIGSDGAPFAKLDADTVSQFTSHVVDWTGSTDVFTKSLRALAFFSVVAHRSFKGDWLAEDSIDHAIDGFASVLRQVNQTLAEFNEETKAPSADLTRLLDMLRRLSTTAAAVIFHVACVNSVQQARLESLATSLLLLHLSVAPEAPKKVREGVAKAVTSAAAELYQAVAAIATHNTRLQHADSFLSRCRLHKGAALRTVPIHGASDAAEVTPLAIALVANSQAFLGPSLVSVVGDTLHSEASIVNERLHGVTRHWVNAIFSRFASQEALKTLDAEEKDASLDTIAFLAEDLASLAQLPQFPAADYSLKTLLLLFVRTYLRSEGANGSGALLDRLRGFSVDVVGNAAMRILTLKEQGPLEGSAVDAGVTDQALSEWMELTKPAPKDAVGGASGSKSKARKSAKKEVVREPTLIDRMQCYAFYNLSRFAASTRGACTWMCARQYLATTWAASAEQPYQLVPVVTSDPVATAAVAEDTFQQVQSQVRFVTSQHERAMLRSQAADALVQAVLNVLKEGEEGSNWDTARKKAMAIIGKLLNHRPNLLLSTWSIARQCVNDDTVKVRESSVALLTTLLENSEKQVNDSESSPDQNTLKTLALNCFSAILHLLKDRSATVSSKAVTAIASLISKSTTLQEDPDLTKSILSQLLHVFCTENNPKIKIEISLIFTKRWFANEELGLQDLEQSLSESSTMGSQSQHQLPINDSFGTMAEELLHLTLQDLVLPYEITVEHPLAVLLKSVVKTAEKAMETASKGKKPAGGKGSRKEKEVAKIASASFSYSTLIKGVARYLMQGVSTEPPRHDPASAVATLNLLAHVHAEWVIPFVPSLVSQHLQLPEKVTDLSEASRICIFHTCHIISACLLQTPSVPLENVANNLTRILSQYSGAYQQKILLAAAGGLCAMIEPGTRNAGAVPNAVYLKHVYVLMNQYFYRTRALLATLGTNDQHVAYARRFLFLLSEFLRLYKWGPWNAKLAQIDTAPVPNELAAGPGIMENSHRILSALSEHAPPHARQSCLTICVRMVGSLCMQNPTEYLRRSETLIRSGLDASADVSLQIQSLMVVKDFLVDEDARLQAATEAPADSEAVSSPGGSSLTASLIKGKAADHNSGMTTWVLQRFNKEVVALSLSPSVQCRFLAFEVIDIAVQQGLIAPALMVEPLIALSADPQHNQLRAKATRTLQGLIDRHDDTVAGKSVPAVIRFYDALLLMGDDSVRGGFTEPDDVVPHLSVFEHIFPFITRCRKRREMFICGLMRYFYQDSKLSEWTTVHVKSSAEEQDPKFDKAFAAVAADGAVLAPVRLLLFLTGAVALLPMSVETEVLLVLEQIRCAVDLIGEGSAQFLEAMIANGPPAGTNGMEITAAQLLEITKCTSTLLLLAIKTFLRKEYGITAAKLARKAQIGTAGQAYLPHRDPRSRASEDFIKRMTGIHELLLPLGNLTLAAGGDSNNSNQDSKADTPVKGSRKSGRSSKAVKDSKAKWSAPIKRILDDLHSRVTDALEDDSKDTVVVINAGASPEDKKPKPKSRKRLLNKRRRSVLDSDVDGDESDEESSSESD